MVILFGPDFYPTAVEDAKRFASKAKSQQNLMPLASFIAMINMSPMAKKIDNQLSTDQMRVSTKEIEDVVRQLQSAFTEGRLSEEELDERMSLALRAKIRSEIFVLTKDLGTAQGEFINALSEYPVRRLGPYAIAVFSGIDTKGQFLLPRNYRIVAIMGGCVLDLSAAQFESKVCDIHVTAIMGGVELLVPRSVRVHLDGMPIMGGFSQNTLTEQLPIDAPTIRIHGIAIMGGIDVKTKG